MDINTVSIIAAGFVGSAHTKALMDLGFNVKVYDTNKEYYLKWPESWALPATKSLEEAANCDVILVCVPTPPAGYSAEGHCFQCDVSLVYETVYNISKLTKNKDQAVVIKSTVPIGYTKMLNDTFANLNIIFSAEFLTESTPLSDLKNPDRIVFGTNSLISEWKDSDVKAFYIIDSIQENGCAAIICNTTEAEMIKLASNSLLSTKVNFANMIYALCKNHSVNYNVVKKGIGADKRIGASHLAVPGPDGKLGYSGSCIVGDEYVTIKENNVLKIITMEELFNKRDNIDSLKILSYNTMCNKNAEFKQIEVLTKRPSEDVYEIKTDKGRKIKATSDHKFIMFENGKFIKKTLRELKSGDFLPILNNYKIKGKNKKYLNLTKVVDKYIDRFPVLRVQLKKRVSNKVVKDAVKNGIISYDQKRTIEKEKYKIIPYKMYITYKNNEFRKNKIIYLITGKNYKNYPQQKVKPILKLDENFAKLLGYYAAEGYKTKHNVSSMRTHWSFGHTEEEQKYADNVVHLLQKCGFVGGTKKKQWRGHYSVTLVTCQSNMFHAIIEYLNCGHNCYEKKFPDFIMQNEKLCNIALSACIEGDGCIIKSKHGYISISTATASKILHQQIGHILHSYNILPSEQIKFGKKAKVNSYQWHVSNKRDIKKISKYLSVNKNKKALLTAIDKYKQKIMNPIKHIILNKDICLVKIKSIKKIKGKHIVYSMRVRDNRNFITTSNLLVSNCFPKDIANLAHCFRKKGLDEEANFLSDIEDMNIKFRRNTDWVNNKYRKGKK